LFMGRHVRTIAVLIVFALVAGLGAHLLIDRRTSRSPSLKSKSSATTTTTKSSATTTTTKSSATTTTTTHSRSTISTSGGNAGAPTGPDLVDAQAMLANEANHGWTTCYVSGAGIAINWDALNEKTVYDWNGTGRPDPCPTPFATRHEDRMTTLRFLHALLLFKTDTGSTQFDAEINTIEAHVLTLFRVSNPDLRGWAYDEMIAIAKLSGNSEFDDIASAMLALYARSPYKGPRPDYQFEEASALVQSGQPIYVAQGTAELDHYWDTDYLGNLQLINGPGEIESAENGDIAIALGRAGMTTRAEDIAQGMQNVLWDPVYGGYYEGAIYANGAVTIKSKKTGGRSMNMMELGKILNDQTLITQMDALFHAHIYQSDTAGYEGVLYEQQRDWQPYVIDGTTENWVTSESMGISLVSLLMQ
jgi:hypothetical protein